MKKFKYLLLALFVPVLVSCGSFGEGLLAGLGNMGGYGYGGNSYITPSSGGNMNYLLDPNYAVAQTMAQQQQYNQVFNSIAQQSVNQVLSEEEQEYQTFCKYNKKSDGSNYTKSEWRALKGQAIQNMNSGKSTVVNSNNTNYGRSNSTNTNTSSGGKTCHICHGTKKCWTCGGNRTYINPLTNKRVVCPNCTNGWCSRCNGTGIL